MVTENVDSQPEVVKVAEEVNDNPGKKDKDDEDDSCKQFEYIICDFQIRKTG